MKRWMPAVLVLGLICQEGWAQMPQAEMEFTPGPRMIRAIEQIAGSYAHLGHSLGLSAQQKQGMADLVQRMKTEMWLKEAVLVGMFQELEEKRRRGLLQDHEYRTANALTGGIETDELNFFIESLTALRALLTPEQAAKVQELAHPTMAFRVSQGFNTKIGLMSLDGIGQVYNGFRRELGLTDPQARDIRSLLEDARREVLRVGTEIDLSRVEADELVMRPDIDPEAIRAKMQKTGETEGVLFNKLFEVTDRIQGHLTEEQRTKLAELKRHHIRTSDKQRAGHPGSPHGTPVHQTGFDYFLDQGSRMGINEEQTAALVQVKNETRKALLIEQAKFKASELKLLTLLRGGSDTTLPSEEKLAAAVQGMEQSRSRMTRVKVQAYFDARRVLTAEQQSRAHPPDTFEDGRP
ncbi:MAG: protein of unknown function [Nitrospira sp.]